MKETFYEETVIVNGYEKQERQYNLYRNLSFIFFALTFLWISFVVYAIVSDVFNSASIVIDVAYMIGPSLVFIFLGVLFFKIKNNKCNNFDYTFVSGTIIIAKIIKDIKRKKLIEFDCKDIQKLGKFGSEDYQQLLNNKEVEKVFATKNTVLTGDKNFYYLSVVQQAQRKLVIIECTDQFMAYVLQYVNRLVLEKGFK